MKLEKVWSYKSPNIMTDREKNEILNMVFNAVVENEMCENIGEEIVYYLISKGYVVEEEIEDED